MWRHKTTTKTTQFALQSNCEHKHHFIAAKKYYLFAIQLYFFVLQTYFEWFCAKYRYQMETQRLVQNMRALLCVNSSLGIFPSGGSPRDNSGNLITVDQVQFPGVDCSEVFSDIFIGNE